MEYGARNALGGRLNAASRPVQRAEVTTRALSVDTDESDYRTMALTTLSKRTAAAKKAKKSAKSRKPKAPQIGSAAADWSRWPAGTTFRVLSTGQIYRVDDYGWALSGRNTIDLYMATRSDMNNWGVRTEPIQVIKWGDREESVRVLQARQHHKHVRRMVLQLQGQHAEAAALH